MARKRSVRGVEVFLLGVVFFLNRELRCSANGQQPRTSMRDLENDEAPTIESDVAEPYVVEVGHVNHGDAVIVVAAPADDVMGQLVDLERGFSMLQASST